MSNQFNICDDCESQQPFCDQCADDTKCTSKTNAECVFFHLDCDNPGGLPNLGISCDTDLETILEKIDSLVGNYFNITFAAIDTESVHWVAGGAAGHTPRANVQISPAEGNQIVLDGSGLFVPSAECKVKVDADDTCDYLENQIEGGNDGVVFNTVVKSGGKLHIIPTIDIASLIAQIVNTESFLTLLCDATSSCSSGGGPLPATVSSLDCVGADITGSYISGDPVTGTISIDYTGGNGGFYNAISINSTGVTGLTATASSGFVASGNGTLVLNVTGTPSGPGTASFAVILGGQSCTVNINVGSPAGSIASLDCAGASFNQTLGDYTGTVNVNYTGGNGGTYAGQTINSTGVTGLTLTIGSGNFASGSGTLNFTLGGTPSGSGTASFLINIGGQSCTVSHSIITVSITSSLAGMTITNITGLTGFTFGSPINPGGRQDGGHSAFTGAICVTVTGTPSVTEKITLYVNNVVTDCVAVPSAGTYCFSSHTFLVGDYIRVSGELGNC